MKKYAIIVALLTSLFANDVTDDDNFKEEDIPKILSIIKDGTKEHIPMLLDDYTTLVDVVSFQNAIEYRNRINSHNEMIQTILKTDKGTLIKTTFENNRSYLCSDEEIKQLLKHGAVFVYVFYDLNNTELFKFSVQYKDCQP
ncbi:MAG: hypothetical protein EOM49_02965 [Epsilonproteobacteria bacterium]|jgi:uncharacterized protein YPO0396|uniref:Uncharacterized protein n=1 Tax=Sulfurospirillum cavolei TaxID=366522 RepID=A0A2D3W6X5_9BACT|nr:MULTISPECIES: hypothetical protein [Sulfurospirillum]NCB53893.1 hypothetical protein [Campylobacterota bacterium]KHG34307.1 MAG: hypothetical protein OA34_04150 [Sulfurospirillum sp. MES]MCD8544971.1 hypothetical protein [Sulfurospirillum cavolei]MCP3650968.1 hypothetical protein [Sulfurospirillum sp. DNRA8]MCR1809814.1 hypothetical protein [Sulfurospirillum sp. DNRA8]